MATPTPRVRRTTQNTQYTYNLGRRLYEVKVYPVQSPQGSNIVLYGHENGVTVVWRGGRRLKSPEPKPAQTQSDKEANGSTLDDAVMIIDSDDEDSAPAVAPVFIDEPKFEEEAATDAATVPDIIQTLDLSLGTAAQHLAVPAMGPCSAEEAAWGGADMLKTRMLFAVSSVAGEAFVVTLPLTPPSHESKARPALRDDLFAGNMGNGTWGETLTALNGQKRPSEGLAITVVKRGPSAKSLTPRVVVASHSRDANASLRLWDIPLDAQPGNMMQIEPFQTECLPAPVKAIAFNPAHSTRLLVVVPQAVRIYDYSLPPHSTDDGMEDLLPPQGSWLISLYAPFIKVSTPRAPRKPVVAAAWICQGRAILALLADGQWGIWDIGGISPSANGLFGPNGSGLRGSAITTFSASGYLEGTSPLRNPAASKKSTHGTGNDFVPMTPHSRRDTLATSTAIGPEKLMAVRGGIDVTQTSAPGRGTALGPDEAAVLWLAGPDPVVAVIPGVARFWSTQLKRGLGGGVNLFSGAQPTRMIRLTDLGAGLLGERCSGAACISRPAGLRRASPTEDGFSEGDLPETTLTDGLPVEVVLQGENRVVFLRETEHSQPAANRFSATRKRLARQVNRAVSASAIIAYPPPKKPGSIAYNLSVARGGSLRPALQRPAIADLFEKPVSQPSLFPTGVDNPDERPRSRHDVLSSGAGAGLIFAADLEQAAEAQDNDAAGRNIEEELLDLMDIEGQLATMEHHRDQGTKHVFFEDG